MSVVRELLSGQEMQSVMRCNPQCAGCGPCHRHRVPWVEVPLRRWDIRLLQESDVEVVEAAYDEIGAAEELQRKWLVQTVSPQTT